MYDNDRLHADAASDSELVQKFADITSMIGENNTDLVLVCTAHPFHIDPAIEAANAGANVLVEKPLASDLKDCDMMIEACRANNFKLGVISQRRWYELVRRVKDAIDNGKIGKPVLATINMLGWRNKAYYDSDEWRGTWKRGFKDSSQTQWLVVHSQSDC